jgi:hypothetical protein
MVGRPIVVNGLWGCRGGISGVEVGEKVSGLFTNGCYNNVVLCLVDITIV